MCEKNLPSLAVPSRVAKPSSVKKKDALRETSTELSSNHGGEKTDQAEGGHDGKGDMHA